MNGGDPGIWRAWLAGGVFLSLLVVAFVLLDREEAPAPAEPAPVPVEKPVLPAPRPALGRADLIEAAARAADAAAAGRVPPAENLTLVGRRFTLQLPFGCEGPAGPGATEAAFSYDPESETLRARVRPQVWTESALASIAAGSTGFEAAEGFWIARPWLRSGTCPARPAPEPVAQQADEAETEGNAAAAAELGPEPGALATQATPAPRRETLALVEYFEAGARRSARRNGRPYSVVAQVPADEIDLQRGLRLVIQGRLAQLGAGQPVVCRIEDPSRPPSCVIRAEIERVAITDSTGQRVLGEWRD